jgi:hypothetical protein
MLVVVMVVFGPLTLITPLLELVVVELVTIVVVYGHCEQAPQYQFSQATFHPPCIVEH